ncbi:uncharacterized protein LOC114872276 [Osmia bicornis bicornis]|uniref:uncharacterized protein LOC114872276 n=1 Tax=Osmia bicornis bicornis TaxID=1437191 RepID=UPI001EAEBEBD|nr:uncharacterized protein LOC114872276 [Osmia bicornis bicornis]
MSPASQGGVEVERYIGSCLISSNIRGGSQKIAGKKQEPVIRGKSRSCYGGQNFANGSEQCQVQYGAGGWTGAPLISMTSSPRRCNQQQQQQQQQQSQQVCDQQVSVHLHKNPLSRLAIHTQGAPLILAGRFHNRGKVHTNGTANGVGNTVCGNAAVNSYVHNTGNTGTMNAGVRCPPARPQRPMELSKKQQGNPKSENAAAGNSIANIDSLSIASDESSGSNNSENSLPRIIKPRKRRKKDRKPANNVAISTDVAKHEEQQQQSGAGVASSEQSNVVALKPYVPACYEPRYEAVPAHLRSHRRPGLGREGASMYGMSMQEMVDCRQRYAHRHAETKVLDDNRNVVMPGQMRAILPKDYTRQNGPPRYLHEDGVKDGLGSCQCRYCDPSALIWDVDQNCYSPFLTPSPSTEFCPGHYSQMPLFLSRPSLNCPEQNIDRLFNVDAARLQEKDSCGSNGVVLRRSWSDPTSYFSEEIAAPSRDVGVIGDRGQAESGKRRTLWRGDTIGVPTGNVGSASAAGMNLASPKGLEVSTEIITSPNGHRDLEIKFYSASPNAAPTEEADEDEDFSDIWSYHESKLQQDFRTLLQAEE